MENALKRGLPLLLLLAAAAAFGSYQSPAATPSKNLLPLPSFQSQALEPRPDVLLVYDDQGILDLIAYRDAESALVRVFEPLACETSAESVCGDENSGGWSQNRVTCRRGNKLHDGATTGFAGGFENLLWGHSRYYDPELGRFTQTDPMGYADSMNLYQAFNQSPQNFNDPMGDFSLELFAQWASRAWHAGQRVAQKAKKYKEYKAHPPTGPMLEPVPQNYWQIATEELIPEEIKSLNPIYTYNRLKEAESYQAKAGAEAIGAGGTRPEVQAEIAANLEEANVGYNIAALSHGANMLGWVTLGAAGMNIVSPGAAAVETGAATEGVSAVGAESEVGVGSLTRLRRFFWDPREFSVISKEYWSAKGGAHGSSLHHWGMPQRGAAPQGLRNAGFNLFELPPMKGTFHRSLGLNQWMGFARNWGPQQAFRAAAVEYSIRIGIPLAAGGAGAGGYMIGSEIYNLFAGE